MLDNLAKARTIFIIAHRLSTIRHAGRIVVLDAGKVVETGTHQELLAKGIIYPRFHEIQFGSAATVTADANSRTLPSAPSQ